MKNQSSNHFNQDQKRILLIRPGIGIFLIFLINSFVSNALSNDVEFEAKDLKIIGDGGYFLFDKPVSATSPGQACVFYKKDRFGYKVLGGGWIKS